jgi:adenylate cyclase
MIRRPTTRKIFYGAALGAAVAVLLLMLSQWIMPGLFYSLEVKTLDWRYNAKVSRLTAQRQDNPIEDIIVVDIDNRSLEKLGLFSKWPRSYHAEVIDYVARSGAASICFDILFMEPDADSLIDEGFAEATRRAGKVVHSMSFSRADTNTFLRPMTEAPAVFDAARLSLKLPDEIAQNFPQLDRFDGKVLKLYNHGAALGFANFLPDDDGVIRKMPMFINFAGRQYPSLSLAVVMQMLAAGGRTFVSATGKEIRLGSNSPDLQAVRIPLDERGRLLVNYLGGFQTFRYISYFDVLRKRVPPESFPGKIVLIGTSASGLSDLRPVPFQPPILPGVEIHANIIYNILHQDFIQRQANLSAIFALFAVCMAVGMMAMILHPWLGIVATLLSGGGLHLLAEWYFVAHNHWIDEFQPLVGIGGAFLAAIVYRYLDEEKQKRRIKGMFANYTSASVVDELLKNPAMLKLGGERKFATAFFSDIKNFTTVSEKLSPEDLVTQLNEYLAAMTDIVLRYEGYLDKYEGDAIVAVFGVPVARDDHAASACFAALDMQEALHGLHEKWQQKNRPLLEVRIGLNSGPMIAGNIGGKERFDYTVIGDSVNLASRLEGANKMYGTGIMISEDTYELVKDFVYARELDFIRVKGKTQPVRVYELISKRDRPLSAEWQNVIEEFARGLEFYRRKEWVEAVKAFQRVQTTRAEDGPTQELLRRCEIFLQSPRPKEWDGVFEMRTK